MKGIILCLCLLVGVAVSDNDNWNNFLDMGLDDLNADLIAKHKDVVDLPDFEKAMDTKYLGIGFHLSAEGTHGTFKNLSSLQRESNVELGDDLNGNTYVSFEVGLKEVQVEYENFKSHFLGMETSGKMSASVGVDGLGVNITFIVDDDDHCTQKLNYAKITKLGSFYINFEPSGVMNWFRSHAFTYALDLMSGTIRDKVNEHLEEFLSKYLEQVDICSMFSL